MQVKCKINESRITLIETGMPVKIAVDAIPGLKLTGRVKKVNRYAEPSSFFSSSIKEYATFIEIIDPPENIRTGMTAEVQIFVEQTRRRVADPDSRSVRTWRRNVLAGSTRARTSSRPLKSRSVRPTTRWPASPKDLDEGDMLVLNLRGHLTLMDLARGDSTKTTARCASLARRHGGWTVPRLDPAIGPVDPTGRSRRRRTRWLGRRWRRTAVEADGGGRGATVGPPGGWRRWSRTQHGRARSVERCDTDGDGRLSAEEIGTMERERSGSVTAADTDGDGQAGRVVTRMTKRVQRRWRTPMSMTDAYGSTVRARRRRQPQPRRLATSIRDLTKDYVLKSETVRALRGVSFDVPEGDYVAIMGPSGSGKSTLLNLLGCLDQPTSGSLFLGDDDIAMMTDDQLAEIRSERIGFVFQSYNLIQQLSVVENIQVPLYYQGRLGSNERKRAIELAERVGLGRSPGPPAQPAFRGTATACRDCPEPGQRSFLCAGRRIDRKLGLGRRPTRSWRSLISSTRKAGRSSWSRTKMTWPSGRNESFDSKTACCTPTKRSAKSDEQLLARHSAPRSKN